MVVAGGAVVVAGDVETELDGQCLADAGPDLRVLQVVHRTAGGEQGAGGPLRSSGARPPGQLGSGTPMGLG